MAGKKIEIKQTKADEGVEQEAIDSRRSTPKRKSARGKREDRLTILIPKSLHEEVTLYAQGTRQSVGDILNAYLEDLVSTEEAQKKIAKARAFNEESRGRGAWS